MKLMSHTEQCFEDGVMSKAFIELTKDKNYSVYCHTSIGYIKVDEPEYRNGNTYKVEKK